MENERNESLNPNKGIGLFTIKYEIDVKNSGRDHSYAAGVIAYNDHEAVKELTDFAKKNIKGFKGIKVNEVSFSGGCHAISDAVRSAILKTAILEGKVVSKESYDALVSKKEEKKPTPSKKSIIPKDKE